MSVEHGLEGVAALRRRIEELERDAITTRSEIETLHKKMAEMRGLIAGAFAPVMDSFGDVMRAMFEELHSSGPKGKRLRARLVDNIDHPGAFPGFPKMQEAISLARDMFGVARASANARRRVAHDPKQAAKAGAFKLWGERYAGKHPELRTNEQFADECRRRWPVLGSQKVVLGWCTQWAREARQKSQSAS